MTSRPNVRRIRNYSFGRVFFRNLRMLISLAIIPLFLVVILATNFQHTAVEKEVLLYNSRTGSLLQNSINQLIDSCLKQANFLLTENNINLFLITQKDGYTFYHNDVIYKLMRDQMQANSNLQSIYIYSDINGKFVSNYGETSLSGFFDTGWLNYYRDYKGGNSFFYVFRDGTNSYLQPVRLLSLYKILEHGSGRLGVVVYNINFTEFSRELSQYHGDYDAGLCLCTEDGTVVENIWGDTAGQCLALGESPNENGYWEIGDTIVYRFPVNYTDLYLYSTLSRSAVQQRLQSPLNMTILLIMGVFLLVFALTVFISIRLHLPFKKILKELDSPAWLMSNRVAISRDEEAFILDSIRKMSLKNEQITEELSQRVALLKQAQAVALQSQINPHFLHNTLDSISWTAIRLTGGKNKASVMLTKLAQILRYSLDDVDTLVPLRKELENTRIYLELQELRYNNCFCVEWDIEETILDIHVIKIILQPIVENAIQHGIKPLGKDGLIHISAKPQGSFLQISIRDNGVGIPAERLSAIQNALQSDMIKQNEGIGIVNVHQRIQLFYGKEYGVSISSENGTCVTMNLPLLKGSIPQQ